MRLDPDTLVSNLVVAIPTSTVVFDKFGVPLDSNDNRTLQQVCKDRGIEFEAFLRAMNEIDWSEESPET